MELSDLQRAVAFQALYGAIGPVVKSQGDGLRGDVDRELRDIYERTGAKTYRVVAEGVPMGTYTVVESRAEPERVEHAYDLEDEDMFAEWLRGDGAELAYDFICDHGPEFCAFCATDHVVPDGIVVRYKGGSLQGRVDPHRPRLPEGGVRARHGRAASARGGSEADARGGGRCLGRRRGRSARCATSAHAWAGSARGRSART